MEYSEISDTKIIRRRGCRRRRVLICSIWYRTIGLCHGIEGKNQEVIQQASKAVSGSDYQSYVIRRRL